MFSVFDLFKIGIGPSSSHTVGPMVAGRMFLDKLKKEGQLSNATRIHCELYGSLGATGLGHQSDVAVILGLMGETPSDTDTKMINSRIAKIKQDKKLQLDKQYEVDFDYDKDLIIHMKKSLPFHPNAMTIEAFNGEESVFFDTYYSIGGGFVVDEEAAQKDSQQPEKEETQVSLPYEFSNMKELLDHCERTGKKIPEIIYENEKVFTPVEEINPKLDKIWAVMQECIANGLEAEGTLPGGLNLKRRAKPLYEKLLEEKTDDASSCSPLYEMDWINLYALAVNEENAATGRVVTAPTNGAAGVIPAVMKYLKEFHSEYSNEKMRDFLLTSAAVGMIIKKNASISGAEVGCQGEVGSACSMAAAGIAEVLGGTPWQVENAAEIGLEHNLGLTCDPIAGLVQIPCIERNAIASVKAINAARLALHSSSQHFVSLDKVIKTMRDTGADMSDKYKETSRGGLAINVIEHPVNFVNC